MQIRQQRLCAIRVLAVADPFRQLIDEQDREPGLVKLNGRAGKLRRDKLGRGHDQYAVFLRIHPQAWADHSLVPLAFQKDILRKDLKEKR